MCIQVYSDLSTFLDIWEEIFEIIARLVSAVVSLFSFVFVIRISSFKSDLKFSPTWIVSLCSLSDSKSASYSPSCSCLSKSFSEKFPIMTSRFSISDITSDCLDRFSLHFCFLVEGMAKNESSRKTEFLTEIIRYQNKQRKSNYQEIKRSQWILLKQE